MRVEQALAPEDLGMDYYEAKATLLERLPGPWTPRELSHAARGMAAQSEYAGLSDGAKDWAAKRLGFRSSDGMQAEMVALLEHARQMGLQGLSGAVREFESQVTHLQERAIQIWRSGAR